MPPVPPLWKLFNALRYQPLVEVVVIVLLLYLTERIVSMGSTLEFRKAFVSRLIQACEGSRYVPPPHKGRQQFIAEKLGVAPEAVSKWFHAVSMPRPDKMVRLAELLGVEQTWLTFGISPEMDRQERKAHAKVSDGAVHLAMGLAMLSGAHCGMPGPRDVRGAYVDFYMTTRGSVYPIHVSLARELSKDHYEVLIPKEYRDVRSVAVVQAGVGRYHFLDLPLGLIEEHKTRKSGMYALQISRVDASRYVTGADTWPRIRNFAELA